MTSRTQDGYSSSLTFPETRFTPLKVALSLLGTIVVCLLNAFGMLPTIKLSTVLLLFASASFMLVRGRGAPDLLHPVRVLGALWCFCLALASMRLLSLLSQWNFFTWSCFLTGLVSFVGGFWMIAWLRNSRTNPPEADASEVVLAGGLLSSRKTLVVATICLAIGTAVLAYEYHLIGGVPILSDNPDFTRMQLFGVADQGDPRFDRLFIKLIHPFVEFLKYGVFLVVVLLCQRKGGTRKEVGLSVLLVLVGLLVYGSQGGRGFVVNLMVPSAVLFHYLWRRIRLRQLGAACIVMVLFLGVFGSVRGKISGSLPASFERARAVSGFPEGEVWDGFAFAYLTFTMSFEIFDRLIDDLPAVRPPSGGFLFYSLHRIIPRSNIQEVAFGLYAGGAYITPTFLGEFYGDYGYWGVLFGPLILGLFYGWAYSRGTGRDRVYWIYVRAMLIQMLVFFPYVNLFSMYITWMLDLLFMYLLIRHLSGSERRARQLRRSQDGLTYSPA
jgi:hypothetical protein